MVLHMMLASPTCSLICSTETGQSKTRFIYFSLFFPCFNSPSFREIDAQEFILAVGYLTNKSLEDVVATSFRCIDLNGDGFVSKGGKIFSFFLRKRKNILYYTIKKIKNKK